MTKINVIIPAAGLATRLRPLTTNTSKAMIPVAGKPTIDWILAGNLSKLGDMVGEIIVVVGENPDLENYVTARYAGQNINCVKQAEPNGPLNAIYTGYEELENPNRPLLIWLGDTLNNDDAIVDYISNDVTNMESFIGVSSDIDNQSEWCIIGPGGKFIDKPEASIPDGNALVGIYYIHDHEYLERYFKMVYRTKNQNEISHLLTSGGDIQYNQMNLPNWHDIGQLSTYYNTQAKLINSKSRSFNKIQVDVNTNTLCKTSTQPHILLPEIKWYDNLTPLQSRFVPQILGESDDKFLMNFESGILLSDMMLYDDLTESTWQYIIDRIFSIMGIFWGNYGDIDTLTHNKIHAQTKKMYLPKLESRLNRLAIQFGDSEHEFFTAKERNALSGIADECRHHSMSSLCIHGDLHFGNIIWQADRGAMKLIDPRGKWGSDITNRGDVMYDLYKLAHDIIWDYNFIIADIKPNNNSTLLGHIFRNKIIDVFDVDVYDQVCDGGLMLLASCIPLHEDNPIRQHNMINRVKGFLR